MRRAFTSSLVVLTTLLAMAGCRSAADPAEAQTQRRFGVQMARMNLWREAMFRFRRAVEMNPQDAMAYNNLAVAYEANGDFDNALKAYREALRLDRSNQYIAKNYSRFVEFTSRDKKRPNRVTTNRGAAAATTTTTTATTTTTTDAPPATPATAPAPAPIPGLVPPAAVPPVSVPPPTAPIPPPTDTAPPPTTTTNPPENF